MIISHIVKYLMFFHFHTQGNQSPLSLSIQGGDEELLGILVEKGANINVHCDVSYQKCKHSHHNLYAFVSPLWV